LKQDRQHIGQKKKGQTAIYNVLKVINPTKVSGPDLIVHLVFQNGPLNVNFCFNIPSQSINATKIIQMTELFDPALTRIIRYTIYRNFVHKSSY
jgi:hypothetical protein